MSIFLPPIRFASMSLLLIGCDQTAEVTSTKTARSVSFAAGMESPRPKSATLYPYNVRFDALRYNALAGEHATIVAELRRLLVGTGATLDGSAITDVTQVDACHTRFATSKGATNIEWAKGGNIAPRDEGGRELNDLPGTDGAHTLSVKAGEDADGISGAVGLLVGGCAGGE